MAGQPSPIGVDERGDGILCKYMPDAAGPDFACLEGEWCLFDVQPQCRCGYEQGCQMGERCAPCAGDQCGDDANEYRCRRDVACTVENLGTCAAEPGQVCMAGALSCDAPRVCYGAAAEPGMTICPNAPGGCCPSSHWCFDGSECRCGTHAQCEDGVKCALNSIGFYACSP